MWKGGGEGGLPDVEEGYAPECKEAPLIGAWDQGTNESGYDKDNSHEESRKNVG